MYYRELTKAHDFTGKTELAVTHTHLLSLGTLFFLIVLVLEKAFTLSASRVYRWFFWVYNVGVLWTVAFMAIIGTRQVLGHEPGPAVSGPAGLGHIILTVGFVLLFVCLYGPVTARRSGEDQPEQQVVVAS
jgi:hypothetical protein